MCKFVSKIIDVYMCKHKIIAVSLFKIGYDLKQTTGIFL